MGLKCGRSDGDVDVEQLDEVLHAIEAVDWNRCPVISTETAAIFHKRVREAREAAE